MVAPDIGRRNRMLELEEEEEVVGAVAAVLTSEVPEKER